MTQIKWIGNEFTENEYAQRHGSLIQIMYWYDRTKMWYVKLFPSGGLVYTEAVEKLTPEIKANYPDIFPVENKIGYIGQESLVSALVKTIIGNRHTAAPVENKEVLVEGKEPSEEVKIAHAMSKNSLAKVLENYPKEDWGKDGKEESVNPSLWNICINEAIRKAHRYIDTVSDKQLKLIINELEKLKFLSNNTL